MAELIRFHEEWSGDCRVKLFVEGWPETVAFTPDLLYAADPEFLRYDAPNVTITCANGRAVYRHVLIDRCDRFVFRLAESELRAASPSTERRP